MVIENLQTTSLLEWLFGPGWQQAALLQPWAVAILLPLALLGAYLLVRSVRLGPAKASPQAGAIVTLVLGPLVVLAPSLVGLWFVQRGIGTLPSPHDLLDRVVEPGGRVLARLLGEEWYRGVAYQWLLLMACVTGVIFAVGWLVSALLSGPAAASVRSGQALIETFFDLVRTSPRRVWALTWLAVREAIRRRVIVVFAVFVIVVLFAGWYMNPKSDHPAHLYIQFVLTTTFYLTLAMALFLSTLSLPADIQDHTLHTIVTKPVRKTEIVLGRVLGFTLVGTALLAAMGAISYGFTKRGLTHTHQLTAAQLHKEALPGKDQWLLKGLTSEAHGHQHEVTIDPSSGEAGEATVGTIQDHTHELTIEGAGDEAVYTLGPPKDLFQARVPIYGKLRFISREGLPAERGVNTGDEWTYRSFIAGQTAAAAIWTFEGITADQFPEDQFPKGLPVEMTLEVFRTYKGDVSKGILGSLWVRNPDWGETGRKINVRNFLAKKFAVDQQLIPRTIVSKDRGKTEKLDLFRDIVSSDGRLEIGVQCLQPEQFFGMAQADLYFRARSGLFEANFIKGYLGIWMQMVIVLALGVMFSTFVSGAVAVIATLFSILVGLFSAYVVELAGGKMVGGGPFEAFRRLVNQDNLISEMPQGFSTNLMHIGDQFMERVMWVASSLLPALDNFEFADHVAFGYDVGGTLLMKCLLRTAAFAIPVGVVGYLCLKMREVAK